MNRCVCVFLVAFCFVPTVLLTEHTSMEILKIKSLFSLYRMMTTRWSLLAVLALVLVSPSCAFVLPQPWTRQKHAGRTTSLGYQEETFPPPPGNNIPVSSLFRPPHPANKPTRINKNKKEAWRDEWYAVTFASHILQEDSKEAVAVSVFGHSLVLWKDAQSNILCADDRCPHRQAALSQGRVTDEGKLECRYHGWQFDGGCASHIPQLASGACMPRNACLIMRPVRIKKGVVWVWMGDGDPPKEEADNDMSEQQQVDEPEEPSLALSPEFQMDVPCNFIYLIENILDPSHLHFVHDGEAQGGHKEDGGAFGMDIQNVTREGFHATFWEPANGKEQNETLLVSQVAFEAPGTIYMRNPSKHFEGVTLSQEFHFTPLTKSSTRFLCKVHFRGKGVPKLLTALLKLTPRWIKNLVTCRLIEQDIPLLASQEARVLGSIDRTPLVDSSNDDLLLSTSDRLIMAYRKWIRKYGSDLPWTDAILPNSSDNAGNVCFTEHEQESLSSYRHPRSDWDVTSRYQLHVKKCPVTRKALERVQSAKRWAMYTSAASVLAMVVPAHASLPILHSSKSLSRFLAFTSVLSTAAIPLLHRLNRSFFNTYHHRAELRAKHQRRWWSDGTNLHLLNVFFCVGMLSAFGKYATTTFHPLAIFCLWNNYLGQIVDNTVRAMGKHMGEGPKLQRLTKLGLMLHGSGTPMLAIPMTKIATKTGLIHASKAKFFHMAWLGFSLVELVRWTFYDASQLQVVDSRNQSRHQGQSLARTLTYSSGKVLQCLLPVFAVLLYQLGMGSALVIQGTAIGRRSGLLLLLSLFVSVLTCTLNRPDIQFVGEALHVSSIYAILAKFG